MGVSMYLCLYMYCVFMRLCVCVCVQENTELASQLQRLESSFSVFAQESNPNQLLAHLGRMAVEFHTLSSKVQKNEQRTSLLQVERTALTHSLTHDSFAELL